MGKRFRGKCKECGERVVSRPRGLCHRCFYDPGVLVRHPIVSKYGARVRQDFCGMGAMPEPTMAMPGTPEKEAVLTERAARGENLWHPLDADVRVSRTGRESS